MYIHALPFMCTHAGAAVQVQAHEQRQQQVATGQPTAMPGQPQVSLQPHAWRRRRRPVGAPYVVAPVDHTHAHDSPHYC